MGRDRTAYHEAPSREPCQAVFCWTERPSGERRDTGGGGAGLEPKPRLSVEADGCAFQLFVLADFAHVFCRRFLARPRTVAPKPSRFQPRFESSSRAESARDVGGSSSCDLDSPERRRALPESPGSGHRRDRTSPTARDVRASAPKTPALTDRSRVLGRLVALLAPMEKHPGDRPAGDRDPLAPRGIPSLLAFDLGPRTRATADRGRHGQAHHPNGHRESLAGAEDPSRAVQCDQAMLVEGNKRNAMTP